jgi:hypothetical protein
MTSGSPARGTEIITTRYRNSGSGQRGIFVENGLMMFMTGYHKGFGLSARMKVIHRYMPTEVNELLFYYMWLVQWFWEEMLEIDKVEMKNSTYLWTPAKDEREHDDDAKEAEGWEEADDEEQMEQMEQRMEEMNDIMVMKDDELGVEMMKEEQEKKRQEMARRELKFRK